MRKERQQKLPDAIEAYTKLRDCKGCQGKLRKRQNRERELGYTHQSESELGNAKHSGGSLPDGDDSPCLESFPVATPTGDNVNKW